MNDDYMSHNVRLIPHDLPDFEDDSDWTEYALEWADFAAIGIGAIGLAMVILAGVI